MKNLRLLLVLLVSTACCLISPREARADFQEDAKEIIEQLIQDNVATALVPNTAAHFPMTCDFFPGSIQAMQAKRYTGLPVVIRKELADLAGLVTVMVVDDRKDAPTFFFGTTGTVSKGLYGQSIRMLNALSGGDINSPPAPGAEKPIVEMPLGEYKKPTQGDQSEQWVPSCSFVDYDDKTWTQTSKVKGSKQSVAAAALKVCTETQSTFELELACSIGLAVRDAANGDEKLLPGDAQRSLVAITANAIMTNCSGAPGAGMPGTFSKVLSVIRQAMDAKAKDDITTAVTGFVTTCTGSNEQQKADISRDIPLLVNAISAGVHTASGHSEAATLEQLLVAVSEFAKTRNSKYAQLASLVKNLASLGNDVIVFVRDVQAKNYGAAAGVAFDRLTEVVESQCDASKSPTAMQKLANAPENVGKALATVCYPEHCEQKPQAPKGSADPPDACDPGHKTVLRFLKAVTIYAIDSMTSPSAATNSSIEFRGAAVELIEEASGPGIRRHAYSCKVVPGLVLPNFSLRAAARPGHIGTSAGAFFVYPSIEYLNFRIPPRHVHRFYFGGNLSLLDVLGPFTELATRPASLGIAKHAGTVFGLGFLVVRPEFEFGIPELTKNLVIGTGLGFRFFRAEQPMNGSPIYCVVGISDGACSSSYLNNFEGSVFVKFVP